jgi:hypothetical protein
MNWSDTWLLKFNKSKCKHTHLGPETGTSYSMLDDTIELSNEEKDLGITMDSKLNCTEELEGPSFLVYLHSSSVVSL